MDGDTKKRVWRIIGYSALVFCSFLFFLYKTFPYELIVMRATNGIQRQARMNISIDRVSPYWLSGIQATGVNIRQAVKKGTAEIQIQDLTFRLSILPLLTGTISANFSSVLARGGLSGSVERKNKKIKVKLRLDSINLGALGPPPSVMRRDKQAKPLLAMLFSPVYGRISGDVDLMLPEYGAKIAATKPKAKKTPKRTTRRRTNRRRRTTRRRTRRTTRRRTRRPTQRRGRGIDIQRANGIIDVKIRNFSMGPGYFPAGQMGEVPVPLIQLGNLQLKLKLDKGRVTIIKASAVGDDAEVYVTGYIQLRPRLAYSIFRGKIRFKIKPSFLKRRTTPSLLRSALGMLGPAKGGYHTFKIYAPFRGRPSFRKL